MKIIKTILLAALSTGAVTQLQAQQQTIKTPEVSAQPVVPKPVSETVSKPNPDIVSKGNTDAIALKKKETKPVAADDRKDEEMKPKLAPSNNLIKPGSTIAPGKRSDAERPKPILPG